MKATETLRMLINCRQLVILIVPGILSVENFLPTEYLLVKRFPFSSCHLSTVLFARILLLLFGHAQSCLFLSRV